MSAGGLCLVHLVWPPYGRALLERFIDSYRRHTTGTEHQLLFVMKGFTEGVDRGPWRELLAGVEHDELDAPLGTLDLGTYRSVVERTPEVERYCFTNSNSVVLVDGWLGHIERHLRAPGVGLVGANGSFESAYSAAPRPLRPWRRGFDPFPNPHIRSNNFAMNRELAVSLDWPAPRTKLQAWELESGRRGISRQVRDRGLQLLVIDCDGVAHPPERWRESATFRSGGQVKTLIGDNTTRHYEAASPRRRLQLERLAYGTADGREPRPETAVR